MTHYIDGEFVDEAQASLPASDLAVLRGYGVFDYLRTYGGKPFRLDDHLTRLERSAALIGLALPHPIDEIQRIIEETLARNSHDESSIRIVVTGGSSEDNITPAGKSRLLVFVTPFTNPPAEWFSDGIKVVTERTERYLPEAKTLNYIPAIIALKKAHAQEAIDAIYVDQNGHALEGTTTNLFAFFGDTLVTPGSGVLQGITRQAVIDIAEDIYNVQQRDISLDELLKADEVFITSSNKEICPVRQIDDTIIGAPGINTQRLIEYFQSFTRNFSR